MIYLFHGNDSYTSWANIIDKLKRTHQSYEVVYGDDIKDVNEIFKPVENLTLFNADSEKIPVVKRFSLTKSKTLLKNLESILKKGYKRDIYFWEDESLGKHSQLFLFIQKYGVIFTTKAPSALSMAKFITEFFGNNNLKINQEITEKLLLKLPPDKFAITNELEKIALSARSRSETSVKLEDLDVVAFTDNQDDIWDLADAISKKDKNKSLIILNKLFRKGQDYQFILAVLVNQLELLLIIKMGISEDDVVRKLKIKIKSYFFDKNVFFASHFSLIQLKTLFNKLAGLDFNVKQGRIDAKLALNLLIATL